MKFLHTSLLIFVLAFSVILSVVEGSPAQTRVCSGDSVVLVLNGYMHGSAVWQQSSDHTSWSYASGTQYNDSLVFIATGTYYYRVMVSDSTCSSPFYSDTELVIINPPTPIAKPATGITFDGFNANWTAVSSPGDTAYYTYYLDVSTVPTFASFVAGFNNIEVGSNTDSIYSISPVSCNTTYYYRVRAYSHCGTSANSNTITVSTDTCPIPPIPGGCTVSTCSGNITDLRDNKTYKTVQIGTQCWMAQNLNVGKAIPGEVSQTPGIIEKYCYGYGGSSTDSSKCATYGGLYLWNHMMAYDTSRINAPGPRGICPEGWHLPVDSEWTCLEKTLGGNTIAGGKLKDTVTHLWVPNTGATNSSGFSALPGGQRFVDFSTFSGLGVRAYFWTATESIPSNAWSRSLAAGVDENVYRGIYWEAIGGYSVRCVKD